MLLKIAVGVSILLLGFVIYVATRPAEFRYERSGVINATPEEIFPYISDFNLGGQWSPYEKADPNMSKSITGTPATIGHAFDFASKTSGSGHLEILNVTPNQSVHLQLLMTAPFRADNRVTYTLTPEASGGTRFTWLMEGKGGFVGKLITVVIDCEKMIAGQFSDGIQNLKSLIEGKKGV